MRNSLEHTERSVMKWGNRGWLEIIEYILVSCKNGALKTHVMYKCNLNSHQVRQYLQFLLNCNLLEKHLESSTSKRYTYKTTVRGIRYMDAYNQIAELFIEPDTEKFD